MWVEELNGRDKGELSNRSAFKWPLKLFQSDRIRFVLPPTSLFLSSSRSLAIGNDASMKNHRHGFQRALNYDSELLCCFYFPFGENSNFTFCFSLSSVALAFFSCKLVRQTRR